jgi:hypothetical protein
MAEEAGRNPTLRRWHESPDGSTSAKTASYGTRAFRLLIVMMALAGAIAAWLFLFRGFEPPIFLTIPVTQYPVDWPTNPLANRDSDLLLEHFRGDTNKQKTYASQTRSKMEQELRDLRNLPGKNGQVVHLCANARAREGKVYLLPADANPDTPSTWIALADVLDWVGASGAKHKLLILDLRAVADSRLGMLAEDVAERAQTSLRELEEKQQLPFGVLCACSAGQRSLVSEDLGQSVFGFYLNEALCGFADGYNARARHNGSVSVDELVAFLKARVDRWAKMNRDARQTPMYFGKNPDFDLVQLAHGETQPAPAAAPLGPLPGYLIQGWKLRDGWLKDETFRIAPGAVRRLELALLEAERRWRAGVSSEGDLEAELKRLREEVRQTANFRKPRSLSLIEARKQAGITIEAAPAEQVAKKTDAPSQAKPGQRIDPEAVASLRRLVKDLQGVDDKRFEEVANGQAKFLKSLAAYTPLQLALMVWNIACDDAGPRLDKRALILQRLGLLPDTLPMFVETIFLRRLARLKIDDKPAPDAALTYARNALTQSEALFTCDPRVFGLLEAGFKAAAKNHAEGEKCLFGKELNVLKAETLLQQALADYRALSQPIEQLQDAYQTCDRADLLLPSYAGYLMKWIEVDAADTREKKWYEAVEAVQKLEDLLAAPGDKERLTQASEQAELVQNLLSPLTGAFQWSPSRSQSLGATPRAWSDLDLMLAAPWANAAARQEVWDKRQEIAQKLRERTRDLDENDAHAQVQTSQPAAPGGEGGEPLERSRAVRRAKVVLALLRWGRLVDVDKLDRALAEVSKDSLDAKSWSVFAENLRSVMVRGGPAKLRELQANRDWVAAERLLRLLDPRDVAGSWILSSAKDNPTTALRRGAADRMWKWLGGYYRELAQISNDSFGRFFESAASEYLGDGS